MTATRSNLKRPGSPSPFEADLGSKRAKHSSIKRASKALSATSFLAQRANPFTRTKRSRSPFEDDEVLHTKKSRQDLNGTASSSQVLDEDITLTYKGLTLRNLELFTIDSDGKLTPYVASAVSKAGPVLTPPVTPSAVDHKQDPIAQVTNEKNGKLSPPANVLTPPMTPSTMENQDPMSSRPMEEDFNLPDNFVIAGEVDLFGVTPAKMYIFQGQVTKAYPYAEVVRLSAEQISLASVIPELKDSPLDAVVLDKPQFSYSAYVIEPYGVGLEGYYFEADVMFRGPLQPISDVMKDIFHQEKPALHVTAYLGAGGDWAKPLVPSSLVLRGSFEDISTKVLEILEFTQIGVELSMDRKGSGRDWEFGYGFFGNVNVSLPGTNTPLKAEYLFRERNDQYMLSMRLTDEDWKDIFNVKGFNLSEVQFTGILANASADSQLILQVQAALKWNDTILVVSGGYSKDYSFVEVNVGNLSLKDIGKIFNQMTGAELDIFDHDVTFESLSLIISTEGVCLNGSVKINGYSSANGTIEITENGLHIAGGIGDVTFAEINIKSAKFDVAIGRKDTSGSKTTRFAITGDLSFCNINLKVAAYTEKSASGLFWTLYGEVDGNMSTSSLAADLKGTFLDITVKNLAFIASNKDSPDGSYNRFKYPVRKGIQFCAAIESIPQLEQLMRGSVKGMVLHAGYGSDGLRLGIVLPSERTITFTQNVYTGPLAFELLTGKDVKLLLSADLNVKLDTQPDPLKFQLGLKAGLTDASAYAQMMNDWVNPCNVGKKVIVRGCALEFGIVYAMGMPGAIGIGGQLMIGSKEARVAMKLSQNPKDQLLSAGVKDLGVVDLVKFASTVAEMDIPEPEDFVHFNECDLYLSTGCYLATTYYPPGASLKGDMTLFGKKCKFECTVGQLVKIMATIEHFELGPLKVKGATGADPIVDLEISKDKQVVLIDGAVEVFSASAALHLKAALFPKPEFDFWVNLQLSDLFKLNLAATLTGDVNFKDFSSLAKVDFSMYALMEQHIVDYIVEQLDKSMDSAQEDAKKGFNNAKSIMTAAKEQFKALCQEAENKLESARESYNQKVRAVTNDFNRAKEDLKNTRKRLQGDVDRAEAAFHKAVADATEALRIAREDASSAISSAENDVTTAQTNSDNALNTAQGHLERAKADFYKAFSSAQRDVENTRNQVASCERDVDSIQNTIDAYKRTIDNDWKRAFDLGPQIPALEIARGTAWTALQFAQGVLRGVEGIIQGSSYVAAEGAIGTAQGAVEAAKLAKDAALKAANLTLAGVRETQNGLVQAAEGTLHAVETASDELHVWDAAKTALSAGVSVAEGAVAASEATFNGLSKCAEFVAFDLAKNALEFAKNNTSELDIARAALEVAQESVNLGINIGKWAITNAGQLLNIRKIEFSGSIKSLAGGPPLTINIEGVVLGKEFKVNFSWQCDLVKFIKDLFEKLWEMIKEEAKKIF